LTSTIDDQFERSADYRFLRKSASRLHRATEDLEEEIARNPSANTRRHLARVQFELTNLTESLYRQQPAVVGPSTLSRSIDLARQIDQQIGQIHSSHGPASREEVIQVSAEIETIHPTPIDSTPVEPVPIEPVPIEPSTVESWDEGDLDVLVDEGEEGWTSDPRFLPGGMRTNPLLRDDGTLIGSPFPPRGYLERLQTNNRLPTNYGGDWFDPYRPRRFGGFYGGYFGPYYGGYGWGFGGRIWSIYSGFGPPYLNLFYSGQAFFFY
jgi:hypothetical protein